MFPVTTTSSNGAWNILGIVVSFLHLPLAFNFSPLSLRTPTSTTWIVVHPVLVSYLGILVISGDCQSMTSCAHLSSAFPPTELTAIPVAEVEVTSNDTLI